MTDYLLDTNVLLRAIHTGAPEHPVALGAITVLQARGDRVLVTPQNLIEFWSVASRPAGVNGLGWTLSQVEAEVRHVLTLFPLLWDTAAVFTHWQSLVVAQQVTGRQVHDARLVAVMQAHNVPHLLTFNTTDFTRYPGIGVIDPASV